MDSSLYKSVTTRRNLKYNYYFSAPVGSGGKPVILFAHGFPNTSYEWRYQVTFFKDQGYGLIVPDMLGYGGTDKPERAADYRQSLLCQDVIDILDAENVDKAIAIGHDWGSVLVGRLANYFPSRFIAFAFLALGYLPPSEVKFVDFAAQLATITGRELLGYWTFLASDGAPELIEQNFDSAYSMAFADDPALWKIHVGPTGALKAWIESNNITKIATYVPKEELEKQKKELLECGLAGPVNWYKVKVLDIDPEDNAAIPPENISIKNPVFLGVALQDYICLADIQKAVTSQSVQGPLTIKDFDTGHWIMWQEKDKLNQELLQWMDALFL